MPEWYKTFFNELYGEFLSNQFSEEETLIQVDAVMRVLRLVKGERVLDVPCGLGRLSIPLALMGMRVTGMDATDSYIRSAEREAAEKGVSVRFICRDMRRVGIDGAFDAAFNWFTSFGYFSDEENLLSLRSIFYALAPGGRFAVELMNKTWLLAHWNAKSEQTAGDITLTSEGTFDEETSRINSCWTLEKGKEKATNNCSIRAYNGTELRALLREAGFAEVKVFDAKTLKRFTRHSQRIIAFGKRPE